MKPNVGDVDRAFRFVLGVALLSFIFFSDKDFRWVGLVGLVPIFTGIKGWCPMYAMLGVSTRAASSNDD